jgi:hypothetical protein
MRRIGERIGKRRIGLGKFRYETTTSPRTFIVRVSGIDGPLLLKHALAEARRPKDPAVARRSALSAGFRPRHDRTRRCST